MFRLPKADDQSQLATVTFKLTSSEIWAASQCQHNENGDGVQNGLGFSPTTTAFNPSPVRNIGFFVDAIFWVTNRAAIKALINLLSAVSSTNSPGEWRPPTRHDDAALFNLLPGGLEGGHHLARIRMH